MSGELDLKSTGIVTSPLLLPRLTVTSYDDGICASAGMLTVSAGFSNAYTWGS